MEGGRIDEVCSLLSAGYQTPWSNRNLTLSLTLTRTHTQTLSDGGEGYLGVYELATTEAHGHPFYSHVRSTDNDEASREHYLYRRPDVGTWAVTNNRVNIMHNKVR